eukprot:SAG22_NODE_167_length_16764_cov_34.845245_4_plen_52_part_00
MMIDKNYNLKAIMIDKAINIAVLVTASITGAILWATPFHIGVAWLSCSRMR